MDNKLIEKLIVVQSVIHEIDCAIFTRQNENIFNLALENFEKNVDSLYEANNVDVLDTDKSALLEKYSTILTDFIEEVESLYAYALEKIENCEMNLDTLYFKQSVFNSGDNNSENELKKEKNKQKIQRYNRIISICEKEFEVARNTIDTEIQNYYFNDLKIEANSKDEIDNYILDYLDGFYNNKVKKDIDNVRFYTIVFCKDVDSKQLKIVNS